MRLNSKILLWTLALILLAMPVMGALTDGLVSYWGLDDNADPETDSVASNDLAYYNSPVYTTSGKLGGAYKVNGNGAGAGGNSLEDTTSSVGVSTGLDLCFSWWANYTTFAQNVYHLWDMSTSGAGYISFQTGSANTKLNVYTKGSDGTGQTSGDSSAITQDGSYHHYIYCYNYSTSKNLMYEDTVEIMNEAVPQENMLSPDGFYWATGSAHTYADSSIKYIDEIGFWNRSLTLSDIADLYNSGAGCKPASCGAPPPPGGTNFTILNYDEWNGTQIISFSAIVNGTQYDSNASGVVEVDFLYNNTAELDIIINSTSYFNRTYAGYSPNVSGFLTAYTHEAELCLNATQKVNEAWVTPDSFTIGSNTSTACFNISAGTYNVLAQKAGWYNRTQSFTISALSNTTQTIQNMSYANLTIYVIDGTTNESLSGYDLVIGSVANPSFLETATGVTNHSFYLINDTYNTSITLPGYALTTGYANISVSGDTNYTFKLYRANSVTITILDEITNNLITDNVTIRWTDNTSTWENVTNTGSFFISNLTATNYTLLFYSANYSTRTYSITVGNLSTQFLTAYMISSSYSTIFTIKDQDTGDIMPDVVFTMSKLVNSTWTTVESKYSDITGKVQVYYDPIGNYRFYLAKTDYEDMVFYLNPVLFSTYDVFMVKGSLLNYSVDYDDISLVYSPQTFNNNDNVSFNFLISSPDGLLTDYGITLTYPGGTSSASGVNAIGEQLSVWVNITNATRWDTVKLDYNYTTTISGTRTFTQYLSIRTNATASENTWTANKDRTYGLGLFERVLIVTIIVIFAVGIATMVGNPIAGMAIGLFLFGFMVFLGFIPIWSILPSMFIGFLFLVWKSGGY